jgi:hypothetical protein
VTVWSQHSADWLGFRKCTPGRHRARYAIGTAMIVTLSYLTVLLSCAHPDGKYLGSSVVQSFVHASVTSTTPDRDTDEELCKVVHKQVVALQAFSIGPIFGLTTPHLDIAIGEEAPLLIARLNAFRPPGHGFSPAKVVNFQLSSVLRI